MDITADNLRKLGWYEGRIQEDGGDFYLAQGTAGAKVEYHRSVEDILDKLAETSQEVRVKGLLDMELQENSSLGDYTLRALDYDF